MKQIHLIMSSSSSGKGLLNCDIQHVHFHYLKKAAKNVKARKHGQRRRVPKMIGVPIVEENRGVFVEREYSPKAPYMNTRKHVNNAVVTDKVTFSNYDSHSAFDTTPEVSTGNPQEADLAWINRQAEDLSDFIKDTKERVKGTLDVVLNEDLAAKGEAKMKAYLDNLKISPAAFFEECMKMDVAPIKHSFEMCEPTTPQERDLRDWVNKGVAESRALNASSWEGAFGTPHPLPASVEKVTVHDATWMLRTHLLGLFKQEYAKEDFKDRFLGVGENSGVITSQAHYEALGREDVAMWNVYYCMMVASAMKLPFAEKAWDYYRSLTRATIDSWLPSTVVQVARPNFEDVFGDN